jgi:prephenate dehydratase
MKKFLAIYTGSPASMSSWDELAEQEKKSRTAEGVAAWHAWVEKHKAIIVETGAPLGRTKSVSSSGITDTRNNMTGYTVVQAESHEAAARHFENHLHFTIFPRDGVEIMECFPIPNS